MYCIYSTDKPAHRSISEKIAENFSNAVIAVVDNKEMTIGMNTNPLRISQYSDGKWKFKEQSRYIIRTCSNKT